MATTIDKGHGRIERRTVRTTGLLTVRDAWAGLQQGFEVTRSRTAHGATTVEVEYGITSLPPSEADAKSLLDFTREHWAIENELHYVRDGTLGEDGCRVRSGTAPQVLAALRNALVHLYHRIDAPSVPAAIEYLQIHPDRARELLGIPQCE